MRTLQGSQKEPLLLLLHVFNHVLLRGREAVDDLQKSLSYRFLRHSHKVCELLNQSFPIMYNYVDARNDLHIKWLKWMKFTFINKVNEFGYEKRPFYEFVKICAHHN